MEKKAKIATTEKLTGFCEDVRGGLEKALNFMLSTGLEAGAAQSKVTIAPFDQYMIPIEAFLADYQKRSVVVKIYVENDYVGEIYWFFELKTTIIFSSLMRMIPLGAVTDKIKNEIFDGTDQDSFGEVGNQLCGILDRVFRVMTGRNIHLRMDFKKSIYPVEACKPENFLRKEEYVTLIAQLALPQEYGMQEMTLLLPRSLVQVMLDIDVELESFKAKKVLLYHWNPNLLTRIQMEMNSRYTKVIPMDTQDEVFSLLGADNVAAVGIGLRKLRFPLPHDDTIYLRRLAKELINSHIPYFLSWESPSDEGLKELARIGLTQANKLSIEKDFIPWADRITRDPTRAANKPKA